jgi:cytochrome P450
LKEIKKYDERLRENSASVEQDTFLFKLMRFHHDKPDSFTQRDVLGTVTGNVVAGSDTTSISLTAIFWFLIRNPQALEKVISNCMSIRSTANVIVPKLRAEVDALYLNNGSDQPVSFSDAQKMPYLQAVIKEALRLHPATGLTLSRVVPEGGFKFEDHFLPEGVSSHPYERTLFFSIYGPSY